MNDDAPRSWREGGSLRRGDTWLLVADPWLSTARCASAATAALGFQSTPIPVRDYSLSSGSKEAFASTEARYPDGVLVATVLKKSANATGQVF